MNPEISVVMSAYNADAHIDTSIQSILKQSFKDFEFLIINDGSTDQTLNKIKKFAKVDSRITLINQENAVLTKSLIKAIGLSNGRYIARMDADDISSTNRLSLQLSYLRKYPNVEMIGSSVIIIDPSGRQLSKKKLPRSDATIKKRLLYGNQFVHGSVIFSKDVYFSAGGYDENFLYSQDYDLWLRIAKISQCANLPDYLYYLRVHDHSISNKNSDSQLDFAVDAIMKNVPYHKIDSGSLTLRLKGSSKVPTAKDQTNIARIKNTVTARLLLRRGDYKRARLYYSKSTTIESLFMRLILRFTGVASVAKRLYVAITSISK